MGRWLLTIALGLCLAGCETGLFFGYGLPDNDACRDAATLPGKPVSGDCLETLKD